jgi:hypothetical protein
MLQEPEKTKNYAAAMAALNEAMSQMQRRTGPVYELSKKNSHLVNAAWRAAGSPQKPAGSGMQRTETGEWVRIDTPEWRAWRAWIKQREQLRREHGMAGSGGVHYGRAPFYR